MCKSSLHIPQQRGNLILLSILHVLLKQEADIQIEKEGRDKTMDFRDRIELQLLRVSRGAHELTQLIESWSKSPNVNGQPKHLVNGLLRGSLDLQESLLMLSRLQEAEKRMSMTQKRRQQDGADDSFEGTRSRSFHKDCKSGRLQGPSCSGCEPSSSCVELKQVVRDRLVRQNSLQLSSDECRTPPSKHCVLSGRRENFSEVKYHLRHLLLSCHSFRNLAYELFGIFLPKPTFFRSGFFDEHELGTDRLLLDCTEELARRKSREGKASIYQMVRERLANRLAYSSFGHLVEETSEWIKKLARYGQAEDGVVGQDGIHFILEKDLLGEGGVLNAVWGGGWDRRICEEEAEEAVVNVEEQIFSGLVFETAKELFLMKSHGS